MMRDLVLVAIGAAMVAIIAVLIGYLSRPPHVVETAAPAVVQQDGSVILERTPTQDAKPAHDVPKGAKIERVVRVKVRHKIGTAPSYAGDEVNKEKSFSLHGQGLSTGDKPANFDQIPITVDLSLVRLDDDTRRVIASSPDGEIVGGLDIPVDTLATKPRVWAAGISLDPIHQTPGVWIERDLMRVRIGAEANQVHVKGGGRDGEFRVRFGWVW